MRWLHLTDLHLSIKNESLQRAALRESVVAIRNALPKDGVDAVLITGDISNAGDVKEYALAEEILIDPLRQISSLANVPFICCPGNHDLDCDRSVPTRLGDWEQAKQDLFWTRGDAGVRVREPQARAFQAFSLFRARTGLLGVDPLKEACATTAVPTATGTSVVVSCNTAYFSHKSVKDQGLQEPPTPALREALVEAKTLLQGEGVLIVAGHHPLQWFQPNSLDRLRQVLRQYCALYVHGHDHVVKVEFTNGGALTFGFSASYQGHLDQPPQGSYRNGFAVCEIHNGRLHLTVRKWEADVGRWVVETAMPPGVEERSTRISDGYVIPVLGSGQTRTIRTSTPPPTRRFPPEVATLRPVSPWSESDWRDVLARLGSLPREVALAADLIGVEGQAFLFRAEVSGEVWLVGCLSGAGHVLSRSEVINANTVMDEEGVQAYLLITPGGIADDARTTYQKFARSGKRLTVLEGAEFAASILSSTGSKLNSLLSTVDAGEASVDLAYGDGNVWLVVRDRVKNGWFWIAGEDGEKISPSHPIVRSVRQVFDTVRGATYAPTEGQTTLLGAPNPTAPAEFDRSLYLKSALKEFNTIKYAGLATAGPRLQNVHLTDVYVGATADVEDGHGSTTGIVGTIESLLDVLALEPGVRQQLQQQLYRNYGLSPSRETFAAQGVYQRYGSVIILGDPGSGKTCFTKHQILQYCETDSRGSWYARHIPVYVPLAEAARLIVEGLPLSVIASRVTAERGLALASEHVEQLAAAGELALFLDGFDEVDRLEHRIQVMSWLSTELPRLRASGNRVVLTSRPAAVQLVETPPDLRILSLRGLVEGEIRLLSERVLRAQRNVAELRQGRFSEPPPLQDEDRNVVEQILDDCKGSPAIFRLARNPLLLTLLVTIYSNSGRPAAKRHRVYTQAVQTLVAVRARVAGHTPMAESELRKRLGDLAMSQFGRGESALIPKTQALPVLARSMSEQLGREVSMADADKFARDVADTTGLLVLHEGKGVSSPTMGFMHYSFFEYYAANGLLRGDYFKSLRLLVYEPKWREVLLLLAGLSDERDDVTPLVEAIIGLDDEVTSITMENLIVAFDCALEAEVPPERAQRALLSKVAKSVRAGALRGDYALRDDVADRLARLAALTGSKVLREFLSDGLNDDDVATRNAYIEFVGVVGAESQLDDALVGAVDTAAARSSQSMVTILAAAGRCEQLRTKATISLVGEALAGGAALKHAAAKAVSDAPGLAKGEAEWEALRELLDDSNRLVAATAASALIRGRLFLLPDTELGRALLHKVLRHLEDDASLDQRDRITISFTRTDLDVLMSSGSSADRTLAIRLLPWLRDLDAYVYQRIMGIVHEGGEGPDEVVAALGSLRHAGTCHDLLTMADVDDIAELLRAPTGDKLGVDRLRRRDVRIAAVRALVAVGVSRVSLKRILDYMTGVSDHAEFIDGLRALRRLKEPHDEVASFVCSELDSHIPVKGKRTYPKFDRETVDKLSELLELFADQQSDGDPQRAIRYLSTAGDYRVPDQVRRSLLVAAAAATVPTEPVIQAWMKALERPPEGMADLVARGVEDFTRRCRRRLDWVREVYPQLPALRDALVQAYARTWKTANQATDFNGVRLVHFRLALASVQFTHRSYLEVASRQAERKLSDNQMSGHLEPR